MQTPDYLREFCSESEQAVCDMFLQRGYVISPTQHQAGLDAIQQHLAQVSAQHLGLPVPADAKHFLDHIHEHVDGDSLNALRLAAINSLNQQPWLRATYFQLAKTLLEIIVGNELTMQRRVNLSIQLPQDDSSLLETHADVWSGDSPFEVVLWVPLVDCEQTKSMYICDIEKDGEYQQQFAQFSQFDSNELFAAIENDVTFLKIDYGQVMVFCQNIMHGNRVNEAPTTRWSMNCRFKALTSPYGDKRHGEFFEPISIRPATRFGLAYQLPEVNDNA